MLNIAKAVIYREVAWFRRFLADYIVSWILPLLFAAGLVFLPASLSNIDTVVKRMSALYGVELSLVDAYTVSLVLTGIISVVAAVVNDVMQTLFAEFRFMDVSSMILESTDLKKYIAVNAILRPAIMTLMLTLYLAPMLVVIHGLEGLEMFLITEAALLASAISLGVFATLFAVPLTFYTRISRPWTVSNIVAPAILAGAGIYVPLELVPLALRLFASLTPVPYTSRALYAIALKGFPQELKSFAVVLVILTALYITISGLLSKYAEARVRRG